DAPAVAVDEVAADRQPDAHAIGLGGAERLKQAALDLVGEAGAGIRDDDLDLTWAGALRLQRDDPLVTLETGQGIDGIADQIDDHLVNLHLVDQHLRQPRRQLRVHRDALVARADDREPARLLDHAVDVLARTLGLTGGHEAAQSVDDLAAAARLADRLVHQLADLLRLGLASLEQPPARLDIVHDGGERLIQLVGKAGGHLAHDAEARHLQQLGLQLGQAPLRLLALGQIAHEAGEQPVLANPGLAHRELHREPRAVLALADHDAADADDALLAGTQIAGDVVVMALPVGRGHQNADVLPDELLGRVLEQALRGGIDDLNAALLVDGDQPVGGGLDDRLEQRLALG